MTHSYEAFIRQTRNLVYTKRHTKRYITKCNLNKAFREGERKGDSERKKEKKRYSEKERKKERERKRESGERDREREKIMTLSDSK